MKAKLTPEAISFYSNDTQLAKQIKTIFTFLSSREEDVFINLNRIKHTELLSCIHKAYGYLSSRRYDEQIENKEIEINENFILELEQNIEKLLFEKTTIPKTIVKEVIEMLHISIVFRKQEEYAKQSFYSRMRKKYERIYNFKSQNYQDYLKKSSRKKNAQILNENEHKTLCEDVLNQIYLCYNNYMEICRAPSSFIFNPKTFVDYYEIDNQILKPNEELLNKSEFNQIIKEFIHLFYQFIISRNLLKFIQSDYEKEQYFNPLIEIKMLDYLNSDNAKRNKRGDIIFTPLFKLFYDKKISHIESIKGIELLRKIMWDYTNDIPNRLEIYTGKTHFFIDFSNYGFYVIPTRNNKVTKERYKEYTITPLISTIPNNVEIEIEFFISFNGKNEYKNTANKPYFYINNNEQYLRYNYVTTLNKKKENLFSVYLYQDKLIIKRETKDAPNLFKTMTYNEILNFAEIDNYLENTQEDNKSPQSIQDLFKETTNKDDVRDIWI